MINTKHTVHNVIQDAALMNGTCSSIHSPKNHVLYVFYFFAEYQVSDLNT